MPNRTRRWAILCTNALILVAGRGEAHKQDVHQYVVHEAYLLLRASLGFDIPGLHEQIGGLEPFYAGDSAWQRPFVTTGAWREDEEDVVFHYDAYEISPGLNFALVSITHFWDADQGDMPPNTFRLRIEIPPFPPVNLDIGPYENAFDKFRRFADGGWVLWYTRGFEAVNPSNGHALLFSPLLPSAPYGVPLAYTGLTNFYTTRRCTLRTDQNIGYTVYDQTAGQLIDPHTLSTLLVSPALRDAVVWEVLGRMCHLLADQSVPAHAHRDEHGLNPDSYEDFMGGPSNPHLVWNHTNVGPLIVPPPPADPLHFLMYVVQQVADHFGSNGPADGDGNDIAGGNPAPTEIAFLDSIGLATLGQPTSQAGPWTQANLENIRDRTFPLLIRATAGLLHWFSTETGLVTGVASGFADRIPVQTKLFQNFPNPFNPSTNIRFTIPGQCRVVLKVYDMLGRDAGTLVDEVQPAGEYTVSWSGAGMPGGVYLYRLTAGSISASQRMILLK